MFCQICVLNQMILKSTKFLKPKAVQSEPVPRKNLSGGIESDEISISPTGICEGLSNLSTPILMI